MNCLNPVAYIIKQGDTLYRLAVNFNTTVEAVMNSNPGIDPYNLQIGSAIVICPGATPVPPIGTLPPVGCPNPFAYLIKQGDTLYRLAIDYGTTVESLMALNPGIDPYNLQIGSAIIICPEITPVPPTGTLPPVTPVPPIGTLPPVCPVPPVGTLPCPNPCRQINLINKMRKVWSQHVYWTRMLIISIAERLKDQGDITKRLLLNPTDIAVVFSKFYPPEAQKLISKLLTEHLVIGADLITALRDGKTGEAAKLKKEWFKNADEMAKAFSSLNPAYNEAELREMLYTHLDLTTEEVLMRLKGNYSADIAAFDKVEKEALSMADYFTLGLMKQFPEKF